MTDEHSGHLDHSPHSGEKSGRMSAKTQFKRRKSARRTTKHGSARDSVRAGFSSFFSAMEESFKGGGGRAITCMCCRERKCILVVGLLGALVFVGMLLVHVVKHKEVTLRIELVSGSSALLSASMALCVALALAQLMFSVGANTKSKRMLWASMAVDTLLTAAFITVASVIMYALKGGSVDTPILRGRCESKGQKGSGCYSKDEFKNMIIIYGVLLILPAAVLWVVMMCVTWGYVRPPKEEPEPI